MRKFIINKCLKIIKDNNPKISKTKLEEIEYGLVGIYILITKLIIIFAVAFILGIFKEVIVFLFIYTLIRATSFGIHASKSWVCLIVSLLLMIGIPYISLIIKIPLVIKLIILIITTILILLYSPADTEKRPIVNQKRRLTYKIISTVTAIIFMILALTINHNYISNCLMFALIIQSIIILPVTYKIFKAPYNNYKNYKLN